MKTARLERTEDYELFDMHEFNRPIHEDKVLLESMQIHGFMPSSPVQCVRNGGSKLKVIRGHHRIDYAKRLGLPVYYVVDETNTDIFNLEGGKQNWTIPDFANARALAGDEDIEKLLYFQKRHHLPIGAAASLVGGESAGSYNKKRLIKTGTFKVGDLKHANAVVRITDTCREYNVSFATASAFISAISLSLRIPEFDSEHFLQRIRLYNANFRKRGTVDEYLEEIESLYNYGAKNKRFPLSFRAREISRERAKSFGRDAKEEK